jgi:hypothetical protein
MGTAAKVTPVGNVLWSAADKLSKSGGSMP